MSDTAACTLMVLGAMVIAAFFAVVYAHPLVPLTLGF